MRFWDVLGLSCKRGDRDSYTRSSPFFELLPHWTLTIHSTCQEIPEDFRQRADLAFLETLGTSTTVEL